MSRMVRSWEEQARDRRTSTAGGRWTLGTPRGQRRPRWPDPRPRSPGQLALVAVGLWLLGSVVSSLAFLAPVGVVLLVVAGISLFLRPKAREMYWRGRRIELDPAPSAGAHLYRLIYRRS